MAHIAACIWIYLGIYDADLEKDKKSWAYVSDFDKMDDLTKDANVDPLKSNLAMYIFALYWIFETFTTVGYGDYAGGMTREYVVTMFF